jgi:hypothetical protein
MESIEAKLVASAPDFEEEIMEEDDSIEEYKISADEPEMDIKAFFDDVRWLDAKSGKKPLIVRLENNDKFYDALVKMKREDEDLVNSDGGASLCCWPQHTILETQIGCATKFGATYFITPGSYCYLGLGVEFVKKLTLHVDSRGRCDGGSQQSFKDFTYVNVVQSSAAIVQLGRQQLCLGPGRYVIRNPAILVSRVNLNELVSQKFCTIVTEQAGEAVAGVPAHLVPDAVTRTEKLSGTYQECGAITFVRAQPSFCWVIQNVHGQLRTGTGLTMCRGGETFIDFVNRSQCSRTTRPFLLESRDKQTVKVRVQLEWQLLNAKVWVTRNGAFSDIFDAIEEITESLLRDAVAGLTYEACHQQATEGYEGLEKNVRETLKMEAEQLGGVLRSFEIRELKFPLLEELHNVRAKEEAVYNSKIADAQSERTQQEQDFRKQDQKREYKWKEAIKAQEHRIQLHVRNAEEKLKKLEAESKEELTAQESKLNIALHRLRLERDQEIIKQQQEKERAESRNREAILVEKSKADQKVRAALADAASITSKTSATAEAKLAMARADAKAADLIGSAYRNNDAYLQLELARMTSAIQVARAQALSEALGKNSGAMLPPSLQDELVAYNPLAKAE